MMYDSVAGIYDLLMKDVDYISYASYFDGLINKYMDKKPEIVLDVGCGTGTLTCALRDIGYSMIGTDPSDEMLNIALTKDTGDIQYINQRMQDLDLFGTIGAAVSFLDCINHITDMKQLLKGFKKVSLFMEQGGLFIFDMNTQYRFLNVYADNVFYELSEDISYTWVNKYDPRSRICRMDIVYYVKDKDTGLYRRYDTSNRERAYSDEEITNMADESGFDLIAVLADMSYKKPAGNCERQFMVFKKK